MPAPVTKATLLEKLRIERSRLEELLTQLTPEQMEQVIADSGWTVKDILAHLAAWDRRGMCWVQAAVRGEIPHLPEEGKTWDNVDDLNDGTHAANRTRPLSDVLAEFQQTQQQLVAQVDALSEDDLRQRIRGQQRGGPAVVSTLIKWRYRHIREHRKPIEAWMNAQSKANGAKSNGARAEKVVKAHGGEAEPPAVEPLPSLAVVERAAPKYDVGHRIADMQEDERPRERLLAYGPASLSNSELLAILLRVGVKGENAVMMGQRILTTFGGLSGLARTSAKELGAIHGLGEAKACQLLAALELGKRLAAASPVDRPVIGSPADAANLVMLEMSLLDHEQLRVFLLDTKNRVHGITTVYKGTVNSSQVRVAEVFKDAVRHNHPAIIVVHNHPSGDPTPSRDDVRVTKDMVQAGELLGINVLDHIVIGQQRFVSMKERGLGF